MGAVLVVGGVELRKALRAVGPFANPKLSDFARVTLTVTPACTYVTATNGSLAALAIIDTHSIDTDDTDAGGPIEFDVLAGEASLIATVFNPPADLANEAEVRFDVEAEELTITDVSGMIDGRSLQLARTSPGEHAARPLRLFVGAAGTTSRTQIDTDKLPILVPAAAKLIAAAAGIYKQHIVLDHQPMGAGHRGRVLARIGEAFLALAGVPYLTDEEEDDLNQWREGWHTRLTRLAEPSSGARS